MHAVRVCDGCCGCLSRASDTKIIVLTPLPRILTQYLVMTFNSAVFTAILIYNIPLPLGKGCRKTEPHPSSSLMNPSSLITYPKSNPTTAVKAQLPLNSARILIISCDLEMPSLYPSTNGTLALAVQKFLTCMCAAKAIPAMPAFRSTVVVFENEAVDRTKDSSSEERIWG